MSKPSRIALVLGATGGIGTETALALSRHGWQIRAFSRTASPSSNSLASTSCIIRSPHAGAASLILTHGCE